MDDISGCSARIRDMMFAEHSELIEMADISGFTFVTDPTTGIEEALLSVSDVRLPQRTLASPELYADFLKQDVDALDAHALFGRYNNHQYSYSYFIRRSHNRIKISTSVITEQPTSCSTCKVIHLWTSFVCCCWTYHLEQFT